MLVRDVFSQNLSPENKQFLVDQGKADEVELETIAKFLDSRLRHITKTAVNSLQSAQEVQTSARIAPSDDRFVLLSEKVERLTAIVETLANSTASQVQNVSATSRQPPKRQNNSRGRPPYRHRPHQPENSQDRCQTCGLRGHSKEQCRRPQHFTCNRCGRRGHLSYVCTSKN